MYIFLINLKFFFLRVICGFLFSQPGPLDGYSWLLNPAARVPLDGAVRLLSPVYRGSLDGYSQLLIPAARALLGGAVRLITEFVSVSRSTFPVIHPFNPLSFIIFDAFFLLSFKDFFIFGRFFIYKDDWLSCKKIEGCRRDR